MKKNYLVLFFIFVSTICFSQKVHKYCDGDFLFVADDESDFEKAVNNSTKKDFEFSFSHVAIIKIENDSIFVLEATPDKGVTKTSFLDFYNNSKHITVGRLKSKYNTIIKKSLENIEKLIGKEYDNYFDADNDKYYCSELIQQNFLDNNGNHIFEPIKMTFKNSSDNANNDFWEKYFEKLNSDIPEGKNGSNPNSIYNSINVDIIFIEK